MRRSINESYHDAPMHVGQPEVAPRAAEGKLFVVEAEQGQNRRVEVVN